MAQHHKTTTPHGEATVTKKNHARKGFTTAVAGILLASPLALGLNTTAIAQDRPGSPPKAANKARGAGLDKLGSCVADGKNLDVLLLMDETGSLESVYENGQKTDTPGSDPDKNRIPAAQGFIDQLTDLSADSGVKTRIKLAGFGFAYKSHANDPAGYSDWMDVTPDNNGALKDEVARFADRVEEMETDHATGIRGAYTDLMNSSGDEDPCRLLVTFTDGELAMTNGQEKAEQDLCRPGGLADRLRAQGITHVGIGLSSRTSPQDFTMMREITEGGGDCGDRPGDGAFFEADDVGSLFTGFHQALNMGRESSAEVVGEEPFTFVLDDSITDVRFHVITQEKLSERAQIQLVSPSGERVDLKADDEGTVSGSDVQWSTKTEPILRTAGKLSKADNREWEGEWSIRLTGLNEAEKHTKVFNSVEMQPGLHVRVSADGDSADQNQDSRGAQIQLRENGKISLELVDNAENVHPVAGEARSTATFRPSDGSEPIELGSGIDLKSGRAELPVDRIQNLPNSGHLEISTEITTKGRDGREGTKLSPLLNTTALSVAPNDMPQLPGEINFQAEGTETTIEVPVQGPGRVWIPEGTTVKADVLPDGMDELTVSSESQDSGSAVTIEDGETGTLKLTMNFPESSEGTVGGTLPITVSNLEGEKETSAEVPIKGAKIIPLDSTKFALGLVAALLGAMLIPVLLLYAIRWATARIDKKQGFGAQRISLTREGASVRYDGRATPEIDIDRVADNRVTHDGVTFSAVGSQMSVKQFTPNPFATPPVEAKIAPSVGSNGKQNSKNQAQLPLSVQGEWFLTYNEVSRGIDLVVLPRLPLLEEDRQRMTNDILDKAPTLFEQLENQLPEEPEEQQESTQSGGWDAGAAAAVAGDSAQGGWGTAGSDSGWNVGSSGGFGDGPASGGFSDGPASGGYVGNNSSWGAGGSEGFGAGSDTGTTGGDNNPGGWSQPGSGGHSGGWGTPQG